MSALLKISNLSGGYYKEEVVRDLSLNVNQGDFMVIIGPNGSGKTTLLRLVTRVLPLRKGEIFYKNENIAQMNLKEFCRKVAFVSQDASTGFSFTVMELVLMGRIPHLKRLQYETKRDIEIAEEKLSLTDTLSLKDKHIDELSAGERQRVVIARALAQEPELLFLDEPTAHLDIGHQVQTLDLLKKLNRENKLTIVMILHDLNLASAYSNRIALLDKGIIFKEGRPEEVLTYQNIEAVYKTIVLVNDNSVTGKPNIVLVPGEK
ncbi:MAG: ABC transporter ATP-binding protein [Candidatus Omnitrophica bacterium]|nr:ABC transporter ATP-binding protein [Candidatus Omnitrophota bacterium]MBU1923535.1 ABC transporter ATP-binding protein [Candidatus Omnitrophota bacterium]